MEVEASYLRAIQAIAGKTPGEKYKTINVIAGLLARNSVGNSGHADVSVPDVPELLKPLVRVEVAKILRQYEAIIEALKSEDLIVVSRALRTKWFFDGTDSTLVNARYFLDNVFPFIAIRARFKVVKILGIRLKNTKLAEEFFHAVAEQYGVSQAVPLLRACREKFVSKTIIENRIVLSLRMAKAIYRKYPDVIIKYFKGSKPHDDDSRNLERINIRDYKDVLLQVANDRLEDFIEIYKTHHHDIEVKLGRRAAKVFIQTQLHLLMATPYIYLNLLPLDVVTRKLSTDEFAMMFKNSFPAEKDLFKFGALNGTLAYYEPEEERLSVMLNTFREVYGEDLLSCDDSVDVDLVKVLPAADRVKQARSKLENDNDWYLCDTERSWRCYLPVSESIPIIIDEIAKPLDSCTRGQLLCQLVYTSKVNNDEDAILQVLTYIYDKHRNDHKGPFYYSLYECMEYFDLSKFSSAHWTILSKFIKFAELEGDFAQHSSIMGRLLHAALRYNSLNDLSTNDCMRVLVDIQMKTYDTSWNILTNAPDLERKSLELFMEIIPKQYPFDNEIWKDRGEKIIDSLATSIWGFNRRQRVSDRSRKKLSISDYSWLLEKIKSFICDETDSQKYPKQRFLQRIKTEDREVYNNLIRDLDHFWDYGFEVILDVLKKNPQRVLDNWRECFGKIEMGFWADPQLALFVKKSKWYHQLPVNFFNESLQKYTKPSTCRCIVLSLALLSDGETYGKIVEPFLSNNENMSSKYSDARSISYKVLIVFNSNLHKVNPPLSLDVIKKFLNGDHSKIALQSLRSVCHRVPVAKVIPFAQSLMGKRLAIVKHGIRLMYSVLPLEEVYIFFNDLWNTNTHTYIRELVCTKIVDLFCKLRDDRSWKMVMMCLNNLNTNDEATIFQRLTKLSRIPNEYMHKYVNELLNILESIKQQSEYPGKFINHSCRLLRNIDGPITRILSEEFSQDLIKRYLFDFDYDSEIFEAAKCLTINSYLLASKEYNELRFQFFGNFFRDCVKTYWDKPHSKNFKFYPMNFMVQRFFDNFCDTADKSYDVQMFKSLLEIFQSVLQPYQDTLSYTQLHFSMEYNRSRTTMDFGINLANRIPHLIEMLSAERAVSIADRLSHFLKCRDFSESEDEAEKVQPIIEALTSTGDIHCAFIAANLLFDGTSEKLSKRHNAVVYALRNLHHPGISGILNERIATFNYSVDSVN